MLGKYINQFMADAAVMNEKDKPPAMLLEAALIDLLRENYLVKKT